MSWLTSYYRRGPSPPPGSLWWLIASLVVLAVAWAAYASAAP